jgi:ferredoxin
MVDPVIARINADTCTWCGKCKEVCEYTAIREIVTVSGKHIAAIHESVCTGCGICAPVCPENAIEVAKYTDNEIESMIDGFAAEVVLEEKEATGSLDIQEDTQVAFMKEYPQIWKNILKTIGSEKLTIPEIVDVLQIAPEIVTFHLMTMNKYGLVVPAGTNAKEDYYYYKKK